MNDRTDAQLLSAYAESRSEAAFTELVRRQVDFVYSAALRLVRDPHLAEDVTQGVFVALAKNAAQLRDRLVLSGWLHRTALNLAAQTVRTIERRRAREQEAAVMNELLAADPDVSWEHIAPHLDAALGELNEPDRDALLLRYFECKSAREMAQTLGISDEAAQKRVSRAVERLREFFAKRGLTVGASGLAVIISANAIQAAPVGLAATISAAAALAGTAIAASTITSTTKAITMTALQKTLITVTLATAVGSTIYEARQASRLRDENQKLSAGQSQSAGERDAALSAANQTAADLDQLRKDRDELLRLRSEVGMLRTQTNDLANLRAELTTLREKSVNHRATPPGETSSETESQDPVPKEAWAFTGYATPEASAQSLLWALREGDTNALQAYLAGFTPRMRAILERETQSRGSNAFADLGTHETGGMTGFRIRKKIVVSDDMVLLQIESQGEQAPVQTFVMKKVDGDWKFADELKD